MMFFLVQTALHSLPEAQPSKLPQVQPVPNAVHQGESWRDYDFSYDFGYPLADEARSQRPERPKRLNQ